MCVPHWGQISWVSHLCDDCESSEKQIIYESIQAYSKYSYRMLYGEVFVANTLWLPAFVCVVGPGGSTRMQCEYSSHKHSSDANGKKEPWWLFDCVWVLCARGSRCMVERSVFNNHERKRDWSGQENTSSEMPFDARIRRTCERVETGEVQVVHKMNWVKHGNINTNAILPLCIYRMDGWLCAWKCARVYPDQGCFAIRSSSNTRIGRGHWFTRRYSLLYNTRMWLYDIGIETILL